MNKEELIDKAVFYLNGDLTKAENICCASESSFLWNDCGTYQLLNKDVGYYGDFICAAAEFTKRARELGWINGHKWGEEYPTNGEKPDLPDDCIVSIRMRFDDTIGGNDPVSEWVWISAVSFKITDQRYRPVDAEMSKSEPEMSKECLNKFPPVGSICVYTISGRCTSHVEITGHGKYGVLARTMSDSREETYHNWNAEKHRFSKLKSDREKFVESALLSLEHYFEQGDYQRRIIERLYDEGCRFK